MKHLEAGYSLEDFRHCECMVLRALGYHLWRPTALDFAERYASVLNEDQQSAIKEKMYAALELCLRDTDMSYRKPSEVGVAALSYALGLEADTHADMLWDISRYHVHRLGERVLYICSAAMWACKLETRDPIYRKYPSAFDEKDNVFLHVRLMACKK